MNIRYFIILFTSIFIFFSCKKNKTIQLPVTELNSPTSMTLNSVHFTSDSVGHIVGGTNWIDDLYLYTTDAGKTWSADSLKGKEIYSLHFNKDNNGFTAGIDAHLHFKATPNSDWEYHSLGFFDTFRDVAFWDNKNGIIVTGGAFQSGKIIQVTEGFVGEYVDSFEQELSTVYYSDSLTVHIGGYGMILRSTDGGVTWNRTGITADFFRSIHFPTSQIGYAIGFSGSIVKTTNAGKDWNFIRNGDNVGVSNEPFRSVYFVDKNRGYIVGDLGVFWRTTDGGDHWEIVDLMTDIDLHDVFAINRRVYIVGKEGKIFQVED